MSFVELEVQLYFRRQPWMEHKACAGQLDLMFSKHRTEEAKALCATCPVREECLEYAVDLGTLCQGVWGGTSARERARMRRAARDVAA